MDLKQLKTFLHVAETGQIARASERLNLTQPAVSRQIRLLEDDLGEALFLRTGRGLTLTEAGRRFESRIRPVVAELESIAGDIAAPGGEIVGAVSLAVPPSVGAVFVSDVVQSLRAKHPGLSVRVVVALSGAVAEGLLNGRLDLGLLYRPLESAALQAEDLWHEDLFLIGPPSSGLRRESLVRFRDALAGPLILPGPRHGLRGLVERHAARAGLSVQTPVEAESLQVQLELVRRGEGLTLLPLRAVADDLESGRLVAAPVIDPRLSRTTTLAWAKDRRLSRAARAMADEVHARSRQWTIAGERPPKPPSEKARPTVPVPPLIGRE